MPGLLALFRRTVAEVPAYESFLHERAIDPQRVTTLEAFLALPLTTKADYVRPHPLATRCRTGRLSSCDMLAVSSGSTGEPTVWPRSLADEIAISARFEQIFHDSFEADRTQTLAVVCFPLGTWVGGMFSASCCRLLASKGYPITTATPGNNKAESPSAASCTSAPTRRAHCSASRGCPRWCSTIRSSATSKSTRGPWCSRARTACR